MPTLRLLESFLKTLFITSDARILSDSDFRTMSQPKPEWAYIDSLPMPGMFHHSAVAWHAAWDEKLILKDYRFM
jgi:hypothetical protein